MLDRDKHCEMLSANARHRADGMFSGFRLFVQLYSAIVGGAVLLRLQHSDQAASFVLLSNLLVAFVAVASLLIVGDAFRAWYGQRKKLSEVAGKDDAGKDVIAIPGFGPRFGGFVMLVVILVAWGLFWCFNPLRK